MQKIFKKSFHLVILAFSSTVLLSNTNTISPPKAQPKSKLEILENSFSKGKIPNASQIKGILKGLSKEEIEQFDNNHNGFMKAYSMLSPEAFFKIKTDWKIEDAVNTAYLLDDFIKTFIKILDVNKKDLIECEIHLYRNPEEFRRIVASMGLGMGIGGWFREDQCMIVGFWNPDPMYHHETTLIHEATHLINALLMRKWNNAAKMPTWLNEGMAVFFESSYMPWQRKIDIGRNSFSRLMWVKNTINNPELPEDKKWTDSKVLFNYQAMIPPQCYGESWVIVHYLCYAYGESKKKPFSEFKRFWEDVYRGKRSGYYSDLEAFVKERSKQSLDEFIKDVIAYAKKLELPITYTADGKTTIEWELGFPDNYVEKADAPKTPWYIKVKDNPKTMKTPEGDIAMLTIAQIEKSSASDINVSAESLANEYKDFFTPSMENKLERIEIENKSGTASFEGDYLLFDVPLEGKPSEVRLKIPDTEEIELKLRIRIDKGFAGIRFSGTKEDYNTGYYLGIGNSSFVFVDLVALKKAQAEAKDETAKKEANKKHMNFVSAPIKLEEEYELTIKLKDKTATVIGEKGETMVKFDAKDMKAGVISIHVSKASKMRFTGLKAKKP